MRLTTEGSGCKWGILSSVCIWMLLPGCCAAELFGPSNSAQQLLQSQDGVLGADYLDIVAPSNPDTLELLVDALDVMQDGYFQLWEGKWPSVRFPEPIENSRLINLHMRTIGHLPSWEHIPQQRSRLYHVRGITM
jgi:hypothetical protein